MSITLCRHCNYTRQPTDTAPAYECPRCGEFYELSLEPLENSTAPDPGPASSPVAATPATGALSLEPLHQQSATPAPAARAPLSAPAASHAARPAARKPSSAAAAPAAAVLAHGNSTKEKKPAASRPKGKVCPKCRYERKRTDTAPDYECPKCGVIYDKYIAPEKRAEAPDHKGKLKIPALPMTSKIAVLFALAITISVLFALPKLVDDVAFLSRLDYWLTGKIFPMRNQIFAVVLALVPAWLFIFLTQLWDHVQHVARRTQLLMGCIGAYLIGATGWLEMLSYQSKSPIFAALQHLLTICGAFGTLVLLVAILISLRDRNLNAHGKPKLLR
jgi:predicted RNA-binding Zn-ribbon protein involved in translation (DUF1610 family)